ncbi:MAG: Gfo/Idh/MocA family oxidoreductase [Alphaproteobacteria bacterium]|nr:Gfo/Idh/MocA family oxidoreductase [Alphaproteobacteria bacterium]MDX5368113.1 Gfo/Idh/MocA family oxidoreductase [Alphaproteobacteria bacterium]MDX5462952.1 Gfo/Idh/MocA family oxidoreductase [Alphaproteobacteria bacterium]
MTDDTEEPVRLILAGLGRWGQTLVRSVQGVSADVRFTGAVVRREAPVRAFAQANGLTLFPGLEEALGEGAADGFVLATPHSQHEAQALCVLEAGLPVLVEKPLALTRTGAARIMDAAAARGLLAAVGFNRRFAPAMQRMRELARSGALGTLQAVEGNFSGSFAYRYSPEMWRASPQEAPAGGMTPMGVHVLDAMIDLLGPVEAAQTLSTRRVLQIAQDDTTMVSLRFRCGAIGVLTTLTTTAPTWRVQLFGSKGWAMADGHERLIHAPIDGPVTETRYPATDLERAELEAFAAAIRGRADYPVTPEEAVEGVAALEAIVASAADGGWTDVRRAGPGR